MTMKHLQRGVKHLQTGGVVLAALLLAGCGAHLEFPRPPAEKLRCAGDPPLPPPPVTDESNGRYLQGLHGAWQDCSDTVAWWRDWSAALERAGKRQKVK